MRTEHIVVLNLVGFCFFASAAAITAEKQVGEWGLGRTTPAAVQARVEAEPELPITPEAVKEGERLYAAHGCVACHSVDGSMRVGPSLNSIYGRVERLSDGQTVKVDERYLRESLLKPSEKLVAGYMPTMPSFASAMEKRDQDALIVWMKSLK